MFGTRPEILKLAPVVRASETRGVPCRLLHTGQHYDVALDAALFQELGLRDPDVNLRVGSGPHGAQTGMMLGAIEAELHRERPDWVLVQGDTNSTLAGALAASKLGIPLAHLEAGLRSFDRAMPEEQNRVVVDQLADLCLAPTHYQKDHLRAAGVLDARIRVIGNTIADLVLAWAGPRVRQDKAFVTLHRPENVDDPQRLAAVLAAVREVARRNGLEIVFPVHPRTRSRLGSANETGTVAPLSHGATLEHIATSRVVLTDSGGIQEEACILGTPCVTLRKSTERIETLRIGANRLAEPQELLRAVAAALASDARWQQPYGDGKAGQRALDSLC